MKFSPMVRTREVELSSVLLVMEMPSVARAEAAAAVAVVVGAMAGSTTLPPRRRGAG